MIKNKIPYEIISTSDPFVFFFTYQRPEFRELDPSRFPEDLYWYNNLQSMHELLILCEFRPRLEEFIRSKNRIMPKGVATIIEAQSISSEVVRYKIIFASHKITSEWLQISKIDLKGN